jgi:autotransporter strand-loop-strand O-heptosyltransferase
MNVALGDFLNSAKPSLVLVPDPLRAPAQPTPLLALTNANPAPSPQANFASASAPVVSSASAAQSKSAYPPLAEFPTQEGPRGIRFDFNSGCRLMLPRAAHPWKVKLSDLDTGNVLYTTEIVDGRVHSSKRYYVRFRIEVRQQDQLLFSHDYSAADRDILIVFPARTLGETIGWFPYAVKFYEKHKCRLTCGISRKLIPLFRDVYPQISFVTHEEIKPERYYATYRTGLFYNDTSCIQQPCDFRHVGIHRTAGYILGVDPTEVAPRVAVSDSGRPIAEPYVCITVQSTAQAKCWNNPGAWLEIVRFLKSNGYRVICIDRKPVHGAGLVFNQIPNGAEDETGDRPLTERARWLTHADFFVGLSGGLSWLAWAAGTPVVMIGGFTHPLNEFATPYRVINYHTCNSCWNDPTLHFDSQDFLWCPRHKDTPRQFECTRLLTVDHVKSAIRRIPGFGQLASQAAAGTIAPA